MTQTGVFVEIGGSSKKLVSEVDKADKSLNDFNKTGKKTSKGLGNLTKSFKVLSGGIAVVGTAMAGLTVITADNAKEIANLSRVAGVTTTEFQKMAFAAKTVGIEQDKLSDILKDVNDRAGDLLTEKSGELAEFFKRLGISADEAAKMIKGLSSRDTLQLMVKLMKEAGFNMQEMTSGMEMVASDATLLLPLLKNNAKEMERLGDKASDLGVVLSEETLKGMQSTSEKLGDMTAAFKGLGNTIVDEASPALDTVIDSMTIIANMGRVLVKDALGGNELSETAQEAENLEDKFLKAQRQARKLKSEMAADGFPTEDIEDYTLRIGGLEQISKDALSAINELRGTNPEVFSGISSSGSINDQLNTDKEKEKLTPKLLAWRNTWREIKEETQKAYAEQDALEKENNDRRLEAEKEAADQRVDIARREKDEKYSLTASAFNDLSSLMYAENKSLFEIGKAAAISETAISGFYSAQKAYEGGLKISGGNPLVGASFAAASAAATAVQLAGISSTSFGGGSSSNAGAGAQQAGQAVAQAPTKDVNISIAGDTISKQQAGSLIEQLNQEIQDGGQISGINLT